MNPSIVVWWDIFMSSLHFQSSHTVKWISTKPRPIKCVLLLSHNALLLSCLQSRKLQSIQRNCWCEMIREASYFWTPDCLWLLWREWLSRGGSPCCVAVVLWHPDVSALHWLHSIRSRWRQLEMRDVFGDGVMKSGRVGWRGEGWCSRDVGRQEFFTRYNLIGLTLKDITWDIVAYWLFYRWTISPSAAV